MRERLGVDELAIVDERVQEEVWLRYDTHPIRNSSWCSRLQDCGVHVKWTLIPAIETKAPQKKSKVFTKDDLRVLLVMASSVQMPKMASFWL